jgi:hypothetical protein
MAEVKIFDMPWGEIWLGNNELKIRAKSVDQVGEEAGDALAIRFQVPKENLKGSGWLGAIFADVLDGRSSQGPTERVQLKLGFVMDPGPTLRLIATRLGGSNDADEKMVFSLSLDKAEFGVPVTAPGLSQAKEPGQFFSYYQGRRLAFNPQADPESLGKIVIYDAPEGSEANWVAIGEIQPVLYAKRDIE